MRTVLHWQEERPGMVTVSQGGANAARLFGLPFVAVGGYFLYQLIGGALHPGELTMAGWIGLPLMVAVFLVPGWILLTGRKRTRLDATKREATEEFDFLLFTRRRTTRISSDGHVMLRYERAGTRTAKGPVFDRSQARFSVVVYVTGANDQKILLAVFAQNEKPEALAFSAKTAGLLGLDVQDLCYEKGELNSAGVVVDHLGSADAD